MTCWWYGPCELTSISNRNLQILYMFMKCVASTHISYAHLMWFIGFVHPKRCCIPILAVRISESFYWVQEQGTKNMENDIVDDEKILGLCPGEAFGQNLGEMSRLDSSLGNRPANIEAWNNLNRGFKIQLCFLAPYLSSTRMLCTGMPVESRSSCWMGNCT